MFLKDKGVEALVVTNLLGNIIRLASNLILARMLSPEAFAITGLATTIIFAFNMISDGGFRAFILRHKLGDENQVLNTLWSARLLRDFLLAVLMFVFSDLIAAYFQIDDLSQVLKVLSLVFVVSAFLPIGYYAIERQNRVATVLYVKFICTVLSTIFMIIGVYYYKSYWPIIYSMIVNSGLQVLLGYAFIGKKGSSFAFDRSILLEFLKWAKFIIPSSIITLLLTQFDKVLLGKTLTVAELGLYFVAFNFSSAAATFVIEYARGVLQPYMSIVYRETPDEYLTKYYKKKMKISILIAFLLGVLSGGSFVFFELLYDDRYLYILLIIPIMSLVTYTSEMSLVLHGEIKITLVANLIRLGWFFSAAWLGYQYFGTTGLLMAIGLMELCPAIYMMYKLKRLNSIVVINELSILFFGFLGFSLTRFFLMLLNN